MVREGWEYLILFLPTTRSEADLDEFDDKITAAGINGWEAVAMNDDRVLLKRRYP